MAADAEMEVRFETGVPTAYLFEWKVKPGSKVSQGTVLLLYDEKRPGEAGAGSLKKMKATAVGTVSELLKTEGDAMHQGCPVLMMKGCSHPIVMKDMCAECGADLREYGCKREQKGGEASVAMVHSIPELVVSQEQAQVLGKADEARLLKHKKLVLLVDLDQTLIHTTNDDIPANLKDVHHFKLYGGQSPWYHARLRPGTKKFLEKVSQQFELHICTFGARTYAHTIANFLDKDGRYFSHRILSRDECFDPNSKTANLSALFPCGDHLVCIIDDREDVWNFAPNLVHVKPYHFFQHTGDINAPPGLAKTSDKNPEDGGKFFAGLRARRTKQCNQQGIKKPEDSDNKTKQNSAVDVKSTAGGETNDLVTKSPSTNTDSQSSDKASLSESIETHLSASREESVEAPVSLGSSPSTVDENGIEATKDDDVPFEEHSDMLPPTEVAETPVQDDDSMESKAAPSGLDIPATSVECGSVSSEGGGVASELSNKIADTPPSSDIKASGDKETLTEKTANTGNPAEASGLSENGILPADEKKPEKGDAAAEKTETTSGDREEDMVDVEDDDDYLLYLSEILDTIHRTFYETYARQLAEKSGEIPDLKKVIPQVRRRVLKGVRMVFSGIIPTNLSVEKSRAYHVARSLGAAIQPNLVLRSKDNEHLATTHVVAARLGTIKVNEAKRIRGIHVVTPDWLWCCADRWEWVSERLFPLTKETTVDQKLSAPETALSSRLKSPVDSTPSPDPPWVEVFPTYDPVTGKRVNRTSAASVTPPKDAVPTPSSSSEAMAPNFANSFNPLMSFSSEDIASMDQEVEDLLDSPDTDEEEDPGATVRGKRVDKDAEKDLLSSSSSSCSLTAERPHGWGKASRKRKAFSGDEDGDGNEDTESGGDGEYERPKYPRCELPRDSERSDSERDSDEFEDSVGSVDEEMAAAVEREFLGM